MFGAARPKMALCKMHRPAHSEELASLPDQWNQAERSEACEQPEAEASRRTISEGECIERLDQVVARRRDDDRRGGEHSDN